MAVPWGCIALRVFDRESDTLFFCVFLKKITFGRKLQIRYKITPDLCHRKRKETDYTKKTAKNEKVCMDNNDARDELDGTGR